MEAIGTHPLKDGSRYDSFFPKAKITEQTVKKNANVSHTVAFIPKVVRETNWQVRKFVQRELQHLPLETACEKLWHFVKDHIGYQKDKAGIEQVRSPRRLWHDKIGDCDCYSVFIGACLSLLGIPRIIFRITKYSQDFFQHIYPIVPLENGRYITMDCVVKKYNYEEPYTQKQDYPMELNYLDGLPEKESAEDRQLYDDNPLAELGALFKRRNPDKPKSKIGQKLQDFGKKVKTGISKTVHAINRVNPVTVVLRNGLLAALKLNMMKVSQRLKYAYLSDQEAQKRGIDMTKFQKLKQVKDKMEKIFHGAGGKSENFKAAILTGKGNINKEVSGLGYIPPHGIETINLQTPLEEVLGKEIYYSENSEGHELIYGLGQLGEPVTAASVTAASGVLAAIAALLKNIGSIFKGKEDKGNTDFENTSDADSEAANTPAADLDDFSFSQEDTPSTRSAFVTNESGSGESSPGTSQRAGEDTTTDANKDQTWWEKNKKWAKPTAWVTGILAALGIGYGVYNSQQKKKEKKGKSVNGLPKLKSKKKQKKSKSLDGMDDVTPVALM